MKKIKKMINWFYELWLNSLSDKQVEEKYVEAGADFGDALSYEYSMGKCVVFDGMCLEWARWEFEYSKRGYRTISLDDFVDLGGYGKPLKGLSVKRKPKEQIILYAVLYRQKVEK